MIGCMNGLTPCLNIIVCWTTELTHNTVTIRTQDRGNPLRIQPRNLTGCGGHKNSSAENSKLAHFPIVWHYREKALIAGSWALAIMPGIESEVRVSDWIGTLGMNVLP